MNNEIMLSICVPTYGHEKYIAEALDSILMQETKYSYEVLVGEDCSPDKTKEILKRYEDKYPNVFRMHYREKNLFKLGISNGRDLREKAKGKYIVILEGDDYWISKEKIEKQITFLENNTEYLAIAHNCTIVDEHSNPLDNKYPECKETEYTLKHFLYGILPGQTTTIMRRRNIENEIDLSILDKGLVPGDRLLYFALVSQGKIFCLQEKLSAYRYVTNGGSSYSANYKYDFNALEKWHIELVIFARKIGNKKAEIVSEVLYLENIAIAVRNKKISLKNSIGYIKNIKHKFLSGIILTNKFVCMRLFNKR